MKKAVPAARVAPVRKPVPRSVPELHLEIEYVDPKTLNLWDANPRHNDRAAKKLAESIRVHGFGVPVTARTEDGIVYKGNTRVKAAIILGMRAIPVMRRSYADAEDAIRDAVADNRMQDMATWNEDALAEMFKERAEVDLDQLAAETGFDPAEIRGLREGVVPALPQGFDDSQLPSDLPDADLVGFDASAGRFLVVYQNDQEKAALCKLLGIDGKKVAYAFAEIAVISAPKPIAKRKG